MHKSETEKIDSILDEHQQIYRRHNRIDNILAFFACIAWIPCIIAAFGVDGIYLKILFAVLACCGAVCFLFSSSPSCRNHSWSSAVRACFSLCV